MMPWLNWRGKWGEEWAEDFCLVVMADSKAEFLLGIATLSDGCA
jgi:hypothetical protein